MVSLLALIALAACDHITTPDAGEPDAIALYPSKAALEEGDLVQLQVTDATQSGVQASGVSVEWQTSDPRVATVNNGMVRGVRPGQARISARTQSGKAAEATIEVGRTPAQIVLLTEGELETEVGWSLDEPLEARVLSARGLPVVGAEVRFRVTKGAGSTSPVIAVADEDGIVRSDWRLGPVAGEQMVELEAVTHSGTRAAVQAEAHPGAPDRIVVSPSQVSLRLGAPFQFSAQVTDRYGNKLASIPVQWSSTNPDVVRVNTEGWVTGIAPGSAVVEAVPATWNMTAASAALVEQVAASPGNGKKKGHADVTVSDADDDGGDAQVSVTSGDDQIGVVGTTLGEELGIRITDGNGDPVRQFEVTWQVVDGAGSVSRTTTRTNGQGRASVDWTLGPLAGTQRVEAKAGDLGSVTFRAEALVGPVETVTVSPGSGTLEVDQEMGFSATAEDKFGNPIDGSLNATWSVADASTASVSSQGRAKGLAAGTTQVVASVEGVTGDADLAVEGSSSDDDGGGDSSDDGSGGSDSDSGGDDTGGEETADPGQVTDLAVVSTTEYSATLRFTEVDDGTGDPAQYEVRYHLHPIGSGWGQATPVAEGSCSDPVQGQTVGSELNCVVEGLDPDVQYDFQLVAFRVEDGKRVLGTLSNVATGTTAGSDSGDDGSDDGSSGDGGSDSGGDDTSGEETTNPGQVTDLAAVSTTENSATLRFTEVDDGTGNPAQYHVRYHLHPIEWSWGQATHVEEGSCVDPVQGQSVGSELTCVVGGLDPDVKYDFQLVAFRIEDGKRVYGTLSHVATGTTAGSDLEGDAVSEVRITEDEVSFSALGEEVTLEATALDENGGIVSGASIDWTSTDDEVVIVNSSGTLLAKGVGTAMVVASAACCEAAAADSVAVQVDQTVAAVEVDPSSVTLEEGETRQLSGVALDANGFVVDDVTFSWASSNGSVFTVSSVGEVTALDEGSGKVIADADGASGHADVQVAAKDDGGDGSGSGSGSEPWASEDFSGYDTIEDWANAGPDPWQTRLLGTSDMGKVSLVHGEGPNGKTALRYDWFGTGSEGDDPETWCTNAGTQFVQFRLPEELGSGEEFWFEVDVKYSENWTKMTPNDHEGCDRGVGYKWWHAFAPNISQTGGRWELEWHSTSSLGLGGPFTTDPYRSTVSGMEYLYGDGKWHKLQLYIRVPTESDGSIEDGIMRMWINGELVHEHGPFSSEANGIRDIRLGANKNNRHIESMYNMWANIRVWRQDPQW